MDLNFIKWRNIFIFLCAKILGKIWRHKKWTGLIILILFLLVNYWLYNLMVDKKVESSRRRRPVQLKFYKLSQLDGNQDGKVGLDEFLKFSRTQEPKLWKPLELVKLADVNEDNKISFAEFLSAGLNKGFGRRSEKLYFEKVAPIHFKNKDQNGDGFLHVNEFRLLMEELQNTFRSIMDSDMEQVFLARDLNKDKMLTGVDFDDRQFMRTMDKDFDSKVSLIEYLSFSLNGVRKKDKVGMVDVCDERFKKVDKNKDGYLNSEEFLGFRKIEQKYPQFVRDK